MDEIFTKILIALDIVGLSQHTPSVSPEHQGQCLWSGIPVGVVSIFSVLQLLMYATAQPTQGYRKEASTDCQTPDSEETI